MQTKIIATLTRTRENTPLVSIRNLPRDEADLTPDELRALARALNEIAAASDAMQMNVKNFTPRQREYALAV